MFTGMVQALKGRRLKEAEPDTRAGQHVVDARILTDVSGANKNLSVAGHLGDVDHRTEPNLKTLAALDGCDDRIHDRHTLADAPVCRDRRSVPSSEEPGR